MSGTWGWSLEDLRGQGVEPRRTREGSIRAGGDLEGQDFETLSLSTRVVGGRSVEVGGLFWGLGKQVLGGSK